MGQKIIELSGAATDVLYALFFRGALQSGDLPAKSGAAELRELGFAETRHTATEYQKENYFTFLTAAGQEFAIKHLADTRFGKPADKQYCSAITIGVELDTSDAQKALDELDDKIRNSDAFKVLKDGWSFEKNGTLIINGPVYFSETPVSEDAITDAKNGNAMRSDGAMSTSYTINLGIGRNDPVKGTVTFTTDKFGIHSGIDDNVDYLIKNAKANQTAMQNLEAKISQQASVIAGFKDGIAKAVGDEIAKHLKPGGLLWTFLRRGF